MNDARVDPIELELFRNAMLAIADEMALTIARTAFSSVVRDNMDFSTALTDADGRVVAQGLTIAGHLGSIPTAMTTLLTRFGDAAAPGDVFILNDPYNGGSHLPDIFVVRPMFADGVKLGYAATVCHHVDVGGRVAGSNASDSTEIFQEGLCIPPLRLMTGGRRNETLDALIARNVRMPDMVLGDLAAQVAACHAAERHMQELGARVGIDQVPILMKAVCDHAEALTRAALARLPDGVFTFEDAIDDDGVDVGEAIPIRVAVRKQGSAIVVDWTGSSPQTRGAINATLSYTKAATYCAIRSILNDDIPCNDGFLRAIDVIAPLGTVLNVEAPGACAARGLTGFRALDCLYGALAKMVPDEVFAAGDGGVTGISIGGYDAGRKPFVYVEFSSSSTGARPDHDGIDGVSSPMSNLSMPSAELIETEQPLRILACEFLADRGGPGRHRGGTAIGRSFEILAAEATLQVRADRQVHLPYGLAGGQPGAPSANFLTRDGITMRLPSKTTTTVRRGDVFRHETAGSGGHGDPRLRDPALVARDVLNGFVSPERARADYGADPRKADAPVPAAALRSMAAS